MQQEHAVELGVHHEAPVGAPRFEDVFEDLHDRLYRALYFVTGNRADAEELMQDAFMTLWERWSTIDRIEDLTAYLFTIALNGSRMRRRRAQMSARKLIPLAPVHDPYDDVEIREDVRAMLMGLPPRQRAALVLTGIFGYSSEQAASILGIKAPTVRVLASRGRQTLRGDRDA